MSPAASPIPRVVRVLTCSGALLAALAVALSAYAAHGTEGDARAALQTAAVFAFGHGVAIAALARGSLRRLALAALAALLIGTLLFAGAIALSRLAGCRSAPRRSAEPC